MAKSLQILFKKIPGYVLLCIVLFVLLVTRTIYFYIAPDTVLIGAIPDDAFYYLQLAKNRAILGHWTFDGLTPATGFHLLYGYFLYFINIGFGTVSWQKLFLLISLLSCVAISSSAYLCGKLIYELLGNRFALLTTAPFFTSIALNQSTEMMESWLVILCSSATFFLIFYPLKSSGSKVLLPLLCVGLIGSLARSDFGLLPGATLVALCMGYAFAAATKIFFFRALLITIGAGIGVGIVTLHNYYISGNYFQASAQVKLYWSSIIEHKIRAPLDLVAQMVMPIGGGSFRVILPLAILGILLILAARRLKPSKWLESQGFYIGLSSLLTILGYIFLYRHNSLGLQSWYISNFLVPYSLLLATIFYFAFSGKRLAPFLICILFYFVTGVSSLFMAPWPNQIWPFNLSQLIDENNIPGRYASWNAGILGFFINKNVVNIDGLTNDEILPSIKNNQLPEYWVYKNIEYILDDQEMINSHFQRRKGGYDSPLIDKCLSPIELKNPNHLDLGTIKIYRIDRQCLKQNL